jgi:hypothetical protein
MKPLKTLLIVMASVLIFASCKKESDPVIYYGKASLMGTNEVPAVTTTALGTINYSYDPVSRYLTYSLTYAGLTGNPTNNSTTGSGIYGPASAGAASSTLLLPITFPASTNGSASGTLYVDGFAIKEANLLSGLYYINIKTATNANGEIRAQITF